MSSKRPRYLNGPFRETGVIIALTFVGAVIRLWSFDRLGLIHFDEGIYALAGLWSLSSRGLAGIDPMVISYAPAGFPTLVGLSYLVTYPLFGVTDFAAILVSMGSGIVTIPVAGWLARRTFGPGAGGAAAAFAALSGAQIAFSRMALTDSSALLCWLVAIGMGQRFLERPGLWRAFLLGLGVGVSQLFKYSGWISGAIVAASAAIWLLLHPEKWRTRSMAAVWGWGLAAAFVAAAVYWPWFAFVDAHGGYGALLVHQRSYLGGLASWPGHFSIQLAQEKFLSGGPAWAACAGLLAAAGLLTSTGDNALDGRTVARLLIETVGLTALCLVSGSLWWPSLVLLILGTLVAGRGAASESMTVVAVAFTALSVMTPFYHPYARLWLPVEALCWLLLGGLFAAIRSRVELGGRGGSWIRNRASDPLPWFTSCCVVAAVIAAFVPSRQRFMSPLRPSDSLRQASRAILHELPRDVKNLDAYTRPAVSYYVGLGGGVSVHRQPDLAHLLAPGNSNSWALLDLALIRQENISGPDLDRRLAGWATVREIPTTLNPATLLDIDPSAAVGGTLDTLAPLWLLRRKPPEGVR